MPAAAHASESSCNGSRWNPAQSTMLYWLALLGRGVNRFECLAIYSRFPTIADLCFQCPFQHLPPQQFAIQTPEPILRLGFGFPIQRDLKLPNFVWGYYPGCPGHPRVLGFASAP